MINKVDPAMLSGGHPEAVKAAIRMRGETVTGLSEKSGYGGSYLRNVLVRPLFEGEQIIAKFLGISAHLIWPDRYDEDGTPNYAKWRRLRDEKLKRSSRRAA